MRPFPVVEIEVTAKTANQHWDIRIVSQIDILVFDSPPQTFHEDVVEDPAAHGKFVLFRSAVEL